MKTVLLFSKSFLTFILIIGFSTLEAQNHQYTYGSNDLPEWAKLMYSDSASVEKVMELYDAYYKTNPFVKNSHTQYYKHWIHQQQLRIDLSDPKLNEQKHETQVLGTTANWTCIGPFDYDEDAGSMSYAAGAAHVYTVEQAKSNTNILYAGSATAGIWKSTDKGLNWNLVSKSLMLTSVYSIEIDHSNPDIVYAGAEDGRLFKTTNGGTSWTQLNTSVFTSAGHTIKDIVMHPGNTSILLLATENGYFRSTDAGTTFTKLRNGDYQEIEFHPTNANVVYIIYYNASTTRTEFYKSTDAGLTFALKSTGWPSTGEQKRTEISVSPADANKVYANCTGNVNGGSGTYGTYVSTDQGETWTFQCCGTGPGGVPAATTNKNLMGWADDGSDDGGQYYYDLAYGVSHSNANKVFAGGVNLWISTNGGTDFTCPSKWSHSSKPNYVHADIHDIKIYGSDIWIACDGGIWYSNDEGATFNKRFKGIAGTDFWGFGVGYGSVGRRVIVGGAYHNGTQVMDNNVYIGGWMICNGGDGSGGHVNPTNDRIMFNDRGAQKLPGVRTGSVTGITWGKDPNNDYTIGKASNLIYSPTNYNIVYVGNTNSLWKSTNGGTTFTELYNFGEYVSDFDISPVDEKTIFVCTYGSPKKIWRSTDGGTSWTNVSLPTALDKSTGAAYDLVCSGTNANELWAIKIGSTSSLNGFKVFKSGDKGTTWTNISSATLNGENLQHINHHYGTNGGVYIATTKTVYYRNNTLNDWVKFDAGLPAQTPAFKIIPDYWGGKVILGTSRSAYESDFYEKAAPLAAFKADKTTTTCNGSAITFIDQSAVEGITGITRTWNFNGGAASSTTADKVSVTYPIAGNYSVSLTVTDANGTNTKTYTNFITVTGSCPATTDISANAITGINSANKCTTQNFSPSIEILNSGSNTITSYTIKVYLDGTLNKTLPQTGVSIPMGQKATVALGSFDLSKVSAFKVVLENPNGSADNTTNNTLTTYLGGDVLNIPSVTVVSQSSNATGNGADKIFDNDNNTIWHNNWQASAPLPHTLIFNLNGSYNIASLEMLNRQDNNNGYPKDVEFSTSTDGINWSTATTWTFTNTANWQTAYFNGSGAKYLRIKVVSTISGSSVCSMAEVKLRGCTNNVPPVVNITAPSNNATFTAPVSIGITATAADADGTISKVELYNGNTLLATLTNSPYTYSWTGVTAGNYTIKAIAYDNLNATDTASINIIVNQATLDCNGDAGGSAAIDKCGICAGGNTGITANTSCASECLNPIQVFNSTNDGNVAANTLDGNLSTRWSANGDGQWIMYKFPCPRNLSGIELAFYNGNVRTSTFDVLVSADSSTWTTLLSNEVSSGTTLDLESFALSATQIYFVKIVGHGNSQSTWNSITETVFDFNLVNDCNGEKGGLAFLDSCATCAGGSTGLIPILDINACTTGITENNKTTAVNVFPNPNVGNFNLKLQNIPGENIQVKIVSVDGKTVFQKNITLSSLVNENISLNSVSEGIYFIHLNNENYNATLKIQVMETHKPEKKSQHKY